MNKKAAVVISYISMLYGIIWIVLGVYLLNFPKIFTNPAALMEEFLSGEAFLVVAIIGLIYILLGAGNFMSGVFILKKKEYAIKVLFTFLVITSALNSMDGIDANAMVFIVLSIAIIASVLSYQDSFAIYQQGGIVSEETSLKLRKLFKYLGILCIAGAILLGLVIYFLTNSDSDSSTFTSQVETLKWSVTMPDGRRYEGAATDETPHGIGILTWPNGKIYEGMFVKGKMEGKGKISLPGGVSFSGEFVDNAPHGKGVCTFSGGNSEQCTFENGQRID